MPYYNNWEKAIVEYVPTNTPGGQIRKTRTEKGVTLKNLATAVNVSTYMMSQFERNFTVIPPDTLQKIANTLDVPVSSINIPYDKKLYKMLQTQNMLYLFETEDPLAELKALSEPPKSPEKQALAADIDNLVEIILTKFGPQHQACILIEEMAELIQVLCKIQRGTFNREKLTEEFSHVMVSCEVIRQLMRIEPKDISAQVHEKLSEYLTS